MKKISVKKALTLLIIIGIVGLSAIFVMARKNKSLFEYTTITAQKADLTQTVSETGVIKTTKLFDLSFEQGGTIKKINTDVGQIVQKGQILVELDHSSLDFKLAQVNASLDIARANLSKLQAGATRQDLNISIANYNRAKAAYDSSTIELSKYKITLNENISQLQKTLSDLEDKSVDTITTFEQAVNSAQTNLDNTKTTYQKDIDNSISTSLTNAEAQASSINNSLDQINSILTDTDIDEYLSVKNKIYLSASQRAYDEAIILLTTVKTDIPQIKINPNKDNVSNLLVNVLNTLNKTYLSLNNNFSALENSVTSSSFSKTQLDALKAIINSQIGIISAGITSVQSSNYGLDNAILSFSTKVDTANDALTQANANLDNAISTAKNNLANTINSGNQQITSIEAKIDSANKTLLVSQAELNKIKSPARIEDIRLYQAQLRQAQSEIDSTNNQIEKSKLKSPLAGTITKLNFEIDEQYIMGRPMITLISGNEYEIDVDISESDITKINIGNKVSITLDAFSSDVKLYGSISFIEPAETVIQEVIYYKVKVLLDANDANTKFVKPGMTANVEITTNKKTNIIAIPGRAIVDKNEEGKFVKTFNNNVLEEKKVKVGIVGDGGLMEILSGISEGDKVVTFTKEN